VKIRVPPTHEQMIATGRRSSHVTSWRGPVDMLFPLQHMPPASRM
jgi:hypothetical protein